VKELTEEQIARLVEQVKMCRELDQQAKLENEKLQALKVELDIDDEQIKAYMETAAWKGGLKAGREFRK
jgi:hypothetical protein